MNEKIREWEGPLFGHKWLFLRHRGNSHRFYIHRKINGKWVNVNLGTSDPDEAIEHYIERLGKKVSRNRSIRCDAAFDTFMEEFDEGPETKKLYLGLWKNWAKDLLGSRRVSDVEPEDIIQVLTRAKTMPSKKTGRKLSPDRRRNLYVMLSAFFTNCTEPPIIRDDNPVSRIGDKHRPAMPTTTRVGEISVVAQKDSDAIAAALQARSKTNGYILATLLELSPEFGWRISEALGLVVTDYRRAPFTSAPHGEIHIERQLAKLVNEEEGIKPPDEIPAFSPTDPRSWFWPLKGEKGKVGSRLRIVPCSEWAEEVLNRYVDRGLAEGWLRPNGLLFPSTKHTPRSQSTTTTLIGDTAVKLGLRRITPHYFRHTFASNQLAEGASLEEIALLLGDTVKTVTDRYAHLQDRKKFSERVAARGRKVRV